MGYEALYWLWYEAFNIEHDHIIIAENLAFIAQLISQ